MAGQAARPHLYSKLNAGIPAAVLKGREVDVLVKVGDYSRVGRVLIDRPHFGDILHREEGEQVLF